MSAERQTISVIIVTHNEEKNIAECLHSVSWVDEIVVIDSMSTDRTAELAHQFTPNVVVTEWKGYGGTKNFALSRTSSEWIFWIDADERMTPQLADEIKRIVHSSTENVSAYEVARRAYFLGKWIRHCGWYPGYVIRLFRRSSGRFTESSVHERLVIDGAVGRLQNDLLHFTDDDLFHYLDKLNHYTSLAAQDLRQAGKRYSLFDLLVRPPYLFIKMFMFKLGFLDGMHGLVLSLLSAAYVFCKYAKLREVQPYVVNSSGSTDAH